MTAVDTAPDVTWIPICGYDDLLPERGVAALLGDLPAAVFRTFDGTLYAVGNIDPFSGASVMSRGIIGSRGDVPTVASPLHKQVFDLTTGRCLDDAAVSLPVYPVGIEDGVVLIGLDHSAGHQGTA